MSLTKIQNLKKLINKIFKFSMKMMILMIFIIKTRSLKILIKFSRTFKAKKNLKNVQKYSMIYQIRQMTKFHNLNKTYKAEDNLKYKIMKIILIRIMKINIKINKKLMKKMKQYKKK